MPLQVFVEPPLFVSSQLQADQIGATTQCTVTVTGAYEEGCQSTQPHFVSNLIAQDTLQPTILNTEKGLKLPSSHFGSQLSL